MNHQRTSEEIAEHLSDRSVPWRDVVVFTVLAYVMAWSLFFAVIPDLTGLFSAERTPKELDVPAVAILGMFAPALAAVIMRRFVSKEGFKGSLGARGRRVDFLRATLSPLIVVAAVILVAEVTGRGDFTAPDQGLPLAVAVLTVQAFTVISVLTFGEEYGWRGYLLPRLLPLGETKAAVIVGLIWGPWHAPMLVAGLNFVDVHPWAAIAIFVPAGIAISLVVTRIFVAAGASVLVATVFHAALNSYSDNLADSDHLSGNPLVVAPGGLVGISMLVGAAVVMRRLHSSRSTRAEAPETRDLARAA